MVALAHNVHAFDNLFVAHEILEQQQLVLELITRGHKIMQLAINNIIFRDTFLFMHSRLADLPKTLTWMNYLGRGITIFFQYTAQSRVRWFISRPGL